MTARKFDRKLLFLSGKIGSGKDNVLHMITAHLTGKKVICVRFANAIKEIVSKVTKTNIQKCYDEKKYIPKSFVPVKEMVNIISKYHAPIYSKKVVCEKAEILAGKLKQLEVAGQMKSLGQLQVLIGNDFRFLFGQRIWIHIQLAWLRTQDYDLAVVVDGRFKREAHVFKRLGATLLRIERSLELRNSSLCGRNPNDITETDLDDYKFDFTITNNYKTKRELNNEIEKLLVKII